MQTDTPQLSLTPASQILKKDVSEGDMRHAALFEGKQ